MRLVVEVPIVLNHFVYSIELSHLMRRRIEFHSLTYIFHLYIPSIYSIYIFHLYIPSIYSTGLSGIYLGLFISL